jgi:NAD(P)-dependent dehydrogenase (short-subunit alcohol dehydrogenase family)
MSSLTGRSAIVTGAAQGLGRAFAAALTRAGANLTVCDVQPAVREVAKALPGPGEAHAIVADVASEADVVALVDAALARFGRIDTLVNNAARWRRTPVTDAFEKALPDWSFVMDTNLRGLLLLSRACVPHLVAAGGGDIVNVSTYYVLPAKGPGTNAPDTDLYNASKWALNGFTQAWARVLAPERVRVNALCMGATDTPMLRGLWAGDPPADFAATWLRPEQIAQQLVDLLCEGPDGRTGENIGAWVGEPVALGPRKPAHRTITG